MSANEDDTAIKINTLAESKVAVKAQPKTEALEISPEVFAKKCTLSEPDDENESDQTELKNSDLPEPVDNSDTKGETSQSETRQDKTEEDNLNTDPESPSEDLSSRFKRMHLSVPKINYAEKIVFCLDMSSDMEKLSFKMGDGSQHTPLNMVKRTIELFVENKHFINRKHEFSLMVLYESATWVREFTNDPKEIIDSLQDLSETQACSSCDLASIVTLITDKYEMKIPRKVALLPYIFRIILVYGRSSCMIHFSNDEAREFLIHYPFFILDIIYIHDPPTSENKCQEIYEALCDLDETNKSYIFEVSRNTTKLHNCMAKLLTHPVQRCAQKDASYSIRPPQEGE